MNNIEALIRKLCPNGVEYKWLGEVISIKMCKRVLKNERNQIGEIPFYKIGTIGKFPDEYISKKLFKYLKNNYNFPRIGEIIITCSGTLGKMILFNGEDSYFQDSNIIWLSNKEKYVKNKFLKYFLSSINFTKFSEGGTIGRLYNRNIEKIKIPIPPLEIQEKIVKILDVFNDLTNELANELTLRKKQYEYYRNYLLDFSEEKINMIIKREK